jgi:hypothetical protein
MARARWLVTRLPLAIEAALALTLASVSVAIVPDRRTARLLGRLHANQTGGPSSDVAPAQAIRVGNAVEQIAMVLPWHPVCLPRAVAVTAMLRRRRIACRAHLGVVIATRTAHAWVTVGPTVVQGAPLDGVTEVAAFG